MITIYKRDETDFSHNGLADITNYVLDAEVSWTDNNTYMLSFKYDIHQKYAELIDGDMIVKAPVPDRKNDTDLFIIKKPKIVDDLIEVTAYQISYELTENFIEDTYIVGKSGQAAMPQISNATQFPHRFHLYSDIETAANIRMVRMNPIEAIMDSGKDNTFINRYGGHAYRNYFEFGMLQGFGQDSGVEIRNKKNLLGFESDVDWTTICTRAMPKGFDGLLLPEKYIDSPNIKKYPMPKIMVLDFPDIKAIKEGEETQDENAVPLEEAYTRLRLATKRAFEVEHVDTPIANYKVDFIELSQTEEYKHFKNLEKIYPCDTVTVIHDDRAIEIKVEMVSCKFDPVAKRYKSIELGNFSQSFTDIKGKIDNLESGFTERAKDAANNLINAGFGGHVRVYPDRILIMDTNDENTARNVWQWNLNGFGHSSNGVGGDYEDIAITMDGKISGKFIQIGFNEIAQGIKILEDGFYSQWGNTNTVLNAQGIEYSDKNGKYVGRLGLTYAVKDDKNSSLILAGKDSEVALGVFDKENAKIINPVLIVAPTNGGITKGEINAYGDIISNADIRFNNGVKSYISGKDSGVMIASEKKTAGGYNIVFGEGTTESYDIYAGFSNDSSSFFGNDLLVDGTLVVGRDFMVSGSKNGVIQTRDGNRLMYAYEMPEYYFGDIGEAETKGGMCIVNIEELFGDTVNTIEDYHVFVSAYSDAKVWVAEREKKHFVVKADKDTTFFSWELKAKRKGYEKERMKKVSMKGKDAKVISKRIEKQLKKEREEKGGIYD